jgi:hypothetical protein
MNASHCVCTSDPARTRKRWRFMKKPNSGAHDIPVATLHEAMGGSVIFFPRQCPNRASPALLFKCCAKKRRISHSPHLSIKVAILVIVREMDYDSLIERSE